MSEASTCPFEWVNNERDPRPNGLHPSKSRYGGQNMSVASEFEFTQNAHETTPKAEVAQYHHHYLFSPPITTIKKAIENDQLKSFPGLEKALLKHLPMSSATMKGHMHKQRKGFRSTQANQEEIKEARQYLADINPPQLICNTTSPNVFCYTALADTATGKIFTDLPVRFPVQYVRNIQYIFVLRGLYGTQLVTEK